MCGNHVPLGTNIFQITTLHVLEFVHLPFTLGGAPMHANILGLLPITRAQGLSSIHPYIHRNWLLALELARKLFPQS